MKNKKWDERNITLRLHPDWRRREEKVTFKIHVEFWRKSNKDVESWNPPKSVKNSILSSTVKFKSPNKFLCPVWKLKQQFHITYCVAISGLSDAFCKKNLIALHYVNIPIDKLLSQNLHSKSATPRGHLLVEKRTILSIWLY